MRNLIILLWKYQYFILFLFFESVAGYMLVKGNDFQNASVINSANKVSANILVVVNNITHYIGLSEENNNLASENAALKSLLPSAFYDDRLELHTVVDSNLRQRYSYIASRVINNSTGRRNNYLTLNSGSLKGVKPEMSVIGPRGIVGIVQHVSENFCTVISVLHKDFKTSAKLKQSSFFGNLEWSGGNPRMADLNDLPKHVLLHKGDTLVTTAFSSVFPEGIMVGTIEDFSLESGANFYDVKLRLSTDFSNLNYVYIVNDLFKEELKTLENSSTND